MGDANLRLQTGRALLLGAALSISLAACGDGSGNENTNDTFNPVNAGTSDAGVTPGGGSVDAAQPPATSSDAGTITQPPATVMDSGTQSVPEASTVDTGTPTTGDAGDAGDTTDGGESDGGPVQGTGTCCPDGNCLCHGPDPSGLTSAAGPFKTATLPANTGTIYYPTDAEPPFAAIALCGGFLNTGPEMADWGTFYASYGIVTLITSTGASDFPDVRADKLLASIKELKGLSSGPLAGKLSDRFGTSGYSMGGGGTTIATATDTTLKSSVGLAAWSPVGAGISTPTLLLCGGSDTTAPCGSNSKTSYDAIPDTTPKMMVTIAGTSHLQWFGPTTDGQRGAAGKFGLAWEKVYLEGDTRWAPLLKEMVSGTTVVTNIK